jgi:predicted lipoprotein with Yx(FWY)xxD motif
MNRKHIVGVLFAAALGIAACGGDDGTPNASPPTPSSTAGVPGTTIAVEAADTLVGTILTGPDGYTLYGFTDDTDARSTCYDTCEATWPPVIVDDSWTVGPDLDSGVFSTVERDDGRLQLVAGKWPLYSYAGDATPGDINGQGSGGVWFVVGRDATLVKDVGTSGAPVAPANEDDGYDAPYAAPTAPEPAPEPEPAAEPEPAPAPANAAVSLRTAESSLGTIIVDPDGMTLYAFTDDTNGTPTCFDACARVWPASQVAGEPVSGEGISAPLRAVDAPGGGTMVVAGKWPLYRFAGDAAPGDTNGQGSGGVWFVVAPDGTLVRA